MHGAQVVIVPIVKNEGDKDKILSACRALQDALHGAGVRCKLDDRLDRSPGFKFNDYEMRVPAHEPGSVTTADAVSACCAQELCIVGQCSKYSAVICTSMPARQHSSWIDWHAGCPCQSGGRPQGCGPKCVRDSTQRQAWQGRQDLWRPDGAQRLCASRAAAPCRGASLLGRPELAQAWC